MSENRRFRVAPLAAVVAVVAVTAVIGVVPRAAQADDPRYTSDGQLIRPGNYREWIYLSTGLGMTYGVQNPAAADASPRFDNVFVTPQAYKAFLETGTWPDKTIFILEVRASTTNG